MGIVEEKYSTGNYLKTKLYHQTKLLATMEEVTITEMTDRMVKYLINKVDAGELEPTKAILPKYQSEEKHTKVYIENKLMDQVHRLYRNHNVTIKHLIELAMQEYILHYKSVNKPSL